MDAPSPSPNSAPGPQPPVPLDYASPGTRKPRRFTLVHLLVIVGVVALATSVLLPSRSQPRETPNKAKCAGNLKQMGHSLKTYALAHDGRLPDGLEQLLLTDEDCPAEVFTCPSTVHEPAPGSTRAEQAANLSGTGHCSYVYLGKGLTTAAPETTPVLCEPADNHNLDGGHVLYLNGQVQFLSLADLRALVGTAATATRPMVP